MTDVLYHPGTSWTDAVWNGRQFVRVCSGPGFVDVGWDPVWARWDIAGADILRYIRAASDLDGNVACIGVAANDRAYLVTDNAVIDMGPVFGQNPVGLYWRNGWVCVIQRSNVSYTVGAITLMFPFPDGTTQGFRDVLPDGTIVFGDDAHHVTIGGVTLHKPNTRGTVTVGQIDGPDRIDGMASAIVHFTAIPGKAFEPHVAHDGGVRYVAVARTALGAAAREMPPFEPAPPIVSPSASVSPSPSPSPSRSPSPSPSASPSPSPSPSDDEPEPPMRQQILFGPNLGSLDFQQLFTESNLWQWSYDRISSFQFYQGHIGPIGVDLGERFCQPNTFDELVEAQAFKKLKEAGILTELQMTGRSGPDIVRKLAARIASEGDGHLGAVCYDHMFQEISAPEFASYVRELRELMPYLIIGAYVAYPMASVPHIRERMQVWDEFNGRPDFLRLDCDYNQRDKYTAAVHAETRAMCHQRGMTYQATINAKEHITDAEYVRQGKAWFDRAKGLGFDAYAIQSWASTPSEEQRQLPHNLNEGDADAHTTLVRYCVEALL